MGEIGTREDGMSHLLSTFVVLASASPMIAAIIPELVYRSKSRLPSWIPFSLLGLSAGMLFAVATLDLIPEGISLSAAQAREEWNEEYVAHEGDLAAGEDVGHHDHDHEHSPEETYVRMSTIGMCLGFLLMMVVEQVMSHFGAGHSHSHGGDDHSGHKHGEKNSNDSDSILSSSFSFAAIVGLGVHSFVDGVMIGGAFSASTEVGGRVGLAIVLRKFPDGFVISSILQGIKGTFNNAPEARRNTIIGFIYRYMSFFILCAVCFMTPVGAASSYALLEGMPDVGLGFVLCFGAGTFLFITCAGIIPELLHQNRMLTLITFSAGYVLFLTTDSLFHAH